VASESKKTVLAALFANLSIAAAKTVAGLLGGSVAMLAEAAHSFADTMNQVFLLVSLSLGDREPDEDHPFGYGKERFFWALLCGGVHPRPASRSMGQSRCWSPSVWTLATGCIPQQVEAVSTQIEAELGEVVPEVTQVFLDPTPRELYRTKATVRTS
jgi:Cation efflux family